MSPNRSCPDCGAALPADAPKGLCPKCLLGAALSGSSGDGSAVTADFGPESPGVLDTIARSIGPVPRVMLRGTNPGETPGPMVKADRSDADASIRYRIDGEIARGGMGSVMKGHDPDLGREVALKVLRDDFIDHPDMVCRFVEEAQIGGQLQHPGIVPIYELGTMADRRPFFSMKLVKGHTLAHLLAQRAAARAELARFLAIFESICQTMAYAHARGVIHRDLKPSNVMVGAFGEVQVMDWGLAKVLARGGVIDDASAGRVREETVIATARSGSDSDAALSRAGSVMGTPSYMAPEQARGEVDEIDERADVFALGSILGEILTGQPAFTGRNAGEIQRKAARGDLADALARLDLCGADAELIRIARVCLAAEPGDRPPDASAVASHITAYLTGVQDRMRRAELSSVEERARRKLTTVVAAGLLLLTTLGGLGANYVLQQRAARAASVAKLLGEATTLANLARSTPEDPDRWHAALAAASQAKTAAAGDPGALRSITTMRDELQAGRDAAVRDRTLLVRLGNMYIASQEDLDGSAKNAAFSEAFLAAGLDLDGSPASDVGARIKARPAAVAVALAAAIDEWASVRQFVRGNRAGAKKLLEVARIADPDPWRNRLRTVMERDDREKRLTELRMLMDSASLHALDVGSLNQLGKMLLGSGDAKSSEVVFRQAQRRHPGDVESNLGLASALNFLARPEEAIRFYTAARAIRPASAHDLAHLLEETNQDEEAISIARDLVRSSPRNGPLLLCLGKMLKKNGKGEEAREVLDRSMVALRQSIERRPGERPPPSNPANPLNTPGQNPEAVTVLREGGQPNPRPDPAEDLYQRGLSLRDKGQIDEAIADFREAIRLKPELAAAHYSLGEILRKDKKDPAAADAAFREAIRLEPLKYSIALRNMSDSLAAQNRLEDAAENGRLAVLANPLNPDLHVNLGHVLSLQGKWDESIAAYLEAIRLDPANFNAHNNLSGPLRRQGRFLESADACREAIRLKPDSSSAHHNLGNVLSDLRKLDEAAAAYREAIRLDPGNTFAYNGLGLFLGQQRKFRESIAVLREGLKRDSSNSDIMNNLAWVLLVADDPQLRDATEALELARKAILLAPKDPMIPSTVALAAWRHGHVQESLQMSRRSMELNKGGLGYDWFLMALGLSKTGDAPEARTWFDRAVAWTKANAPRDPDFLALWTEAAKELNLPAPDALPPQPEPAAKP